MTKTSMLTPLPGDVYRVCMQDMLEVPAYLDLSPTSAVEFIDEESIMYVIAVPSWKNTDSCYCLVTVGWVVCPMYVRCWWFKRAGTFELLGRGTKGSIDP